MTDRRRGSAGWHFGFCGALAVAMLAVASGCVANGKLTQAQEAEPKRSCPPDSYTYSNTTGGAVVISYTCANDTSGSIQVLTGSLMTFKESCSAGEADCIECPLVRLLHPLGVVFECGM